MRTRAALSVSAIAATMLFAPGLQAPAYAAYSPIEGSGSTWSQVIVDQWIADVSANGMQVTYSGGGSSQGRKSFAANVTDFGITEIPYQGTDEYGNADTALGREFAYVPIVAGGTAFTYHLEVAGQLVRDIRLSGETLAKIFTNQITTWADPAIAADNNGRVFPESPIIPVVRSDGAGATRQLTQYFDTEFPSLWHAYSGGAGATSYYPRPTGSRMIGAAGSDQVMNTVAASSGNGTIAYIEYSYPVNKGYPVVKVLNAAGYYVEPTQYNVAVALTQAQINTDATSDKYLTQILDGVYTSADPRAYPLSSYSYMLVPTGANDQRMTTNKRQTLVDFIAYSLCEGQGKAGAFGYSPLPLNLVQAGFEQVAKLGAVDAAVDIADLDATRCNNPTFVAGDLSRNRLSEIAPPPTACDQLGQGPCLSVGQDMGQGTIGGQVHLSVDVPESPFGSLFFSVGSSAPVPMQGTRDPDGVVRAAGTLPAVLVNDTRIDGHLSLWEVNVQVSPFVGSTGTLGAEYLGWTPRPPAMMPAIGSALLTQAGGVVASRLAEPASRGLSEGGLLGRAVFPGRGLTTLAADLGLVAPASTPPGTFTATATVTLVSM